MTAVAEKFPHCTEILISPLRPAIGAVKQANAGL
jgi:hypothetical protein